MAAVTGHAEEPLICPTCGAVVGDPARHVAWHRGYGPLVADAVDAAAFADEITFELRRVKRGGVR